eukprot:5499157-Pyramimonas_sp.AAC.1
MPARHGCCEDLVRPAVVRSGRESLKAGNARAKMSYGEGLAPLDPWSSRTLLLLDEGPLSSGPVALALPRDLRSRPSRDASWGRGP